MEYLYQFGKYILMLKELFVRPERKTMYWIETLRQMYQIGVDSIIIVFIISFFIGAVSAVQFAYNLSTTITPMYFVGYIVKESMILEFAPTVSALILAGKVGSNIASELGTMRLTEQIDALEIMGVNTASYVIQPKIIAAVVVIPMLVAVAAFVSIIGGFLSTVPTGWLTSADYIKGLHEFFMPRNVTMMYVKATVFSFILTSVSCYQGYYVQGGNIELGQASTRAVVYSNILILLSDYVIALLLTA